MRAVAGDIEVIPLSANADVELRNVVFEEVAKSEALFDQMRSGSRDWAALEARYLRNAGAG
jgi:hypothetical protein